MQIPEYTEAWDNRHDPQRAAPSGYCRRCGGEIYSDDELYEYDGLCAECFISRRCGNCARHDDFSGACCNGESEYRADFTTSDFVCDQWEERN